MTAAQSATAGFLALVDLGLALAAAPDPRLLQGFNRVEGLVVEFTAEGAEPRRLAGSPAEPTALLDFFEAALAEIRANKTIPASRLELSLINPSLEMRFVAVLQWSTSDLGAARPTKAVTAEPVTYLATSAAFRGAYALCLVVKVVYALLLLHNVVWENGRRAVARGLSRDWAGALRALARWARAGVFGVYFVWSQWPKTPMWLTALAAAEALLEAGRLMMVCFGSHLVPLRRALAECWPALGLLSLVSLLTVTWFAHLALLFGDAQGRVPSLRRVAAQVLFALVDAHVFDFGAQAAGAASVPVALLSFAANWTLKSLMPAVLAAVLLKSYARARAHSQRFYEAVDVAATLGAAQLAAAARASLAFRPVGGGLSAGASLWAVLRHNAQRLAVAGRQMPVTKATFLARVREISAEAQNRRDRAAAALRGRTQTHLCVQFLKAAAFGVTVALCLWLFWALESAGRDAEAARSFDALLRATPGCTGSPATVARHGACVAAILGGVAAQISAGSSRVSAHATFELISAEFAFEREAVGAGADGALVAAPRGLFGGVAQPLTAPLFVNTTQLLVLSTNGVYALELITARPFGSLPAADALAAFVASLPAVLTPATSRSRLDLLCRCGERLCLLSLAAERAPSAALALSPALRALSFSLWAAPGQLCALALILVSSAALAARNLQARFSAFRDSVRAELFQRLVAADLRPKTYINLLLNCDAKRIEGFAELCGVVLARLVGVAWVLLLFVGRFVRAFPLQIIHLLSAVLLCAAAGAALALDASELRHWQRGGPGLAAAARHWAANFERLARLSRVNVALLCLTAVDLLGFGRHLALPRGLLSLARRDVAYFLALFLFCFYGCALLGCLVWSDGLRRFGSLGAAGAQLLQLLHDARPFEQVVAARPAFAWAFTAVFLGACGLLPRVVAYCAVEETVAELCDGAAPTAREAVAGEVHAARRRLRRAKGCLAPAARLAARLLRPLAALFAPHRRPRRAVSRSRRAEGPRPQGPPLHTASVLLWCSHANRLLAAEGRETLGDPPAPPLLFGPESFQRLREEVGCAPLAPRSPSFLRETASRIDVRTAGPNGLSLLQLALPAHLHAPLNRVTSIEGGVLRGSEELEAELARLSEELVRPGAATDPALAARLRKALKSLVFAALGGVPMDLAASLHALAAHALFSKTFNELWHAAPPALRLRLLAEGDCEPAFAVLLFSAASPHSAGQPAAAGASLPAAEMQPLVPEEASVQIWKPHLAKQLALPEALRLLPSADGRCLGWLLLSWEQRLWLLRRGPTDPAHALFARLVAEAPRDAAAPEALFHACAADLRAARDRLLIALCRLQAWRQRPAPPNK